jgi:hypothetical protein
VAVRVAGERIRGRWTGASSPKIGDAALVMVRAEAVRFASEASADENWVAVTPRTTVYKGKYLDLIADSDVGEIICRTWDKEAVANSSSFAVWSPDQTTVAAKNDQPQ